MDGLQPEQLTGMTRDRPKTGPNGRDVLSRLLTRQDTRPIIDRLALIMSVEPTTEALQAWANEHPDKWTAAMATLAKLVGYAERKEVDISLSIDVGQMSDSMLAMRLSNMMQTLALPSAEIVAEAAPCQSSCQPSQTSTASEPSDKQ